MHYIITKNEFMISNHHPDISDYIQKLSSKWPPFGHLDLLKIIFCVHQPFIMLILLPYTTIELMILNRFPVKDSSKTFEGQIDKHTII